MDEPISNETKIQFIILQFRIKLEGMLAENNTRQQMGFALAYSREMFERLNTMLNKEITEIVKNQNIKGV
jgi:hypothetical protein